jgi:histidinol-phosphate aminotransferase
MSVFNQGGAHHDSLTRAHLSENHFKASPAVAEVLERERPRMHLYPDPECRALREALARFYSIDVDMVTVGNGTDELILVTALAFLRSGDAAVMAASTFPGYATSSAIAGAAISRLALDGYRSPIAAMIERCQQQPCVVFLCNPHNPTGTATDLAAVTALVNSARETGSLPIIDEAYAEFAESAGPGGAEFASAIPLIRQGGRALVMRTFSKAYGLAGFRVGYTIGRPEDIARIRQVQAALPFAVNRLAQAVALAALADQPFLSEVVARTVRAKASFYAEMEAAGLGVQRSHTNFVLLRIGGDSKSIAGRLLQDSGILVRDAGLFGLPSHLRVSMLEADSQALLVSAIRRAHAAEAAPLRTYP